MSISKSLFIVFSLMLCFSLLFQQAEHTYSIDYDVPTFADIPQIEADSNVDFNDPLMCCQHFTRTFVPKESKVTLSQVSYLQPSIPPVLRPPRAIYS
ncbi:MAG: hypothetical protein ACAH12_01285 [Methylophilaceae bacterium]|uniref:hypothetical protein n=1 Tax=Methylovorus sp. MM2 TaxID=1848038 RepID=UPI0008327370|nr:hypothetical protein [Methylovorus sp. MM2]